MDQTAEEVRGRYIRSDYCKFRPTAKEFKPDVSSSKQTTTKYTLISADL